ncbi:MAG: BON domain-containing protein [Synechococcales cyanobacterium RU_4_20]|nr:BON domain-containing protein [Synechococcales cyanobacterium RU_4_20]NJR68049.1 BON domain-containing protein [Synechococcales cyanobacterium CRU_2_2]
MGWLSRMFKKDKPAQASVAPKAVGKAPDGNEIPDFRLGLEGEYDDSGLAKRVALAFDNDPEVSDEERLWVAQTSGKVVLKGEVTDQATLDKLVSLAGAVKGATGVDASQVQVG